MPALKYSYDYESHHIPKKKIEKPEEGLIKVNVIKDNSKARARKLNRLIGVLLSIAFLSSMLSYSVVVAQEHKISSLQKNIIELNYENIELENQLEQIKSFYSVNAKVSETKSLDKAKNIIEVTQAGNDVKFVPDKHELKLKNVLGY